MPAAAALGRLSDFPEGAATPAKGVAADGREVAVVVVRSGGELRAYLDLCPHQFLPLTWRGRKVLSADGQRLRCSNHGAEFAVSDGGGVSGPGSACGLTPAALRVEADGSVLLAAGAEPAPG